MLSVITGVCILSAAAILFIKRYSAEHAVLLSIAASVAVLIPITLTFAEVSSEIKDIFDKADLSPSAFTLVIKALGLCYLTNFASDICRDFGQSSLAGKIELAGKLSVVGLSLPLIEEILTAVTELIG